MYIGMTNEESLKPFTRTMAIYRKSGTNSAFGGASPDKIGIRMTERGIGMTVIVHSCELRVASFELWIFLSLVTV